MQQVLALDALDAAEFAKCLIVQEKHDVRLQELHVDQRLASSCSASACSRSTSRASSI